MERNTNCDQPEWTKHCKKVSMVVIIIVVVIIACFSVGMMTADYWIPPQKVTIINANLNRFELSSSTTPCLSYNLTFTMSIHNGIWHNTAEYQDMEVNFYYNMEQFDSIKLHKFRIKPRRTRLFNFSRSGNSTISIGSSVGIDDAFRRSNEATFFDMEIGLNGIRVFGITTRRDVHLSYQCKLNLQLITSQNSNTQGSFKPVRCDYN